MAKITRSYRSGFSILTAIIVVIAMSSISIMVLRTNTQDSRLTLDIARDRQASLWAKSYMNYAKFAIMQNRMQIVEDNSTHALESIHASLGGDAEKGGYEVEVQISYMGVMEPFVCTPTKVLDKNHDNPSAIIDVYVRYNALESQWGGLMTYHSREVVGI